MVLGNCIGHYNIKFFVLLHFYTMLGAANLDALFFLAVFKWGYGSHDKLTFAVQYMVPMIFVTMIGLGSVSQFFSQLYLNLINKTQFEMIMDFKTNIFSSGNRLENLKASFGNVKNKLQWLLPFHYEGTMSDGHNFEFYY